MSYPKPLLSPPHLPDIGLRTVLYPVLATKSEGKAFLTCKKVHRRKCLSPPGNDWSCCYKALPLCCFLSTPVNSSLFKILLLWSQNLTDISSFYQLSTCITNYLKTEWFKITINVTCLAVPLGQEFRSGLTEWCWFGVSNVVEDTMLTGTAVNWRFDRGRVDPLLIIHMDSVVFVVGWGLSSHGFLHRLLSHSMAANFS